MQALELLDNAKRRTQIDAALDRHLGDSLLREPANAQEIADALRHFDEQRYALHAWCVMPNHVHVLVEPLGTYELGAIVRSWKSFSAAKINKQLGRSGRLWAADYFDRYIRNEAHYQATLSYVENNPVKAGLCTAPEEWPYSSALDRAQMRA